MSDIEYVSEQANAQQVQAYSLAGPLAKLLPAVAEDLHRHETVGHLHTMSVTYLECGYCWLRAGRALCAVLDADPDHILDLRTDGWTLKHPLGCRLTDLFDCPVGAQVTAQMQDGPPEHPPGRYVTALTGQGFAVIGDRVQT